MRAPSCLRTRAVFWEAGRRQQAPLLDRALLCVAAHYEEHPIRAAAGLELVGSLAVVCAPPVGHIKWSRLGYFR